MSVQSLHKLKQNRNEDVVFTFGKDILPVFVSITLNFKNLFNYVISKVHFLLL